MKHNIDRLLDLYWDGDTSLEEEEVLQKYFETGEIGVEHMAFKPLFDFRAVQSKIRYPGSDSIGDILDKYWDGTTSIKEEQVLKHYFSSGLVKEEHLVYKDLFAFYISQTDINYPQSTLREADKTVSDKTDSKISYLKIKKWVYAVAAVSILALGAIVVMKNIEQSTSQQQSAMVNEIDDPEEALRVTKEALALVSKKFRASQNKVKENMGALEKAAIFK